MKYANLDYLIEWLEENLKMPFGCCELDEVLDEIETQYNATGYACYELRGCETVSGNPESYFYHVEVEHDKDADSYEFTFYF